MKRILYALFIAFTASSLQAQVCFHPKDSFPTGFGPGQITTGDFNGDTFIDIAVVTTFGGDGIARILLGDGSGGFAAALNDTVGANPYGIHVADFDEDGNLDIASANSGSNDVTILLGDGTGNFSNAGTIPIGSNCRYITSGYFDSDTILDIATCNFSSGNVAVSMGTGGGNFNAPSYFSVGTSPHSIIAADFDENGTTDLATANDGDDDVTVIFGNGDGTFGVASSFSTGVGSSPTGLIAGYFDADAHLDLATANRYTSNISILIGDGLGVFAGAVNYPVVTGSDLYTITSGDYDGDGNIDLAAAHDFGDSLFVVTGNGDGTFDASVGFFTGISPYSITTADFNGDGAPDLATSNNGPSNVLINCNLMDVENISSESSVSVYPNPSMGLFNIGFEKGSQVIEIFDLMGKKVYSSIIPDGQTINKIDFSNHAKGTYFVTIHNGEKIFAKKVVID